MSYNVLALWRESATMSTASNSIKETQLPALSVSIEIYSGIARFPCDSTALVGFGMLSKTRQEITSAKMRLTAVDYKQKKLIRPFNNARGSWVATQELP